MADYEIFGPYLIAMMMGMGALCIFIWGVFSGAFHNSDSAAIQFFQAEMDNDRTRAHIDENWKRQLAPRRA